jgi:hypothetical protein
MTDDDIPRLPYKGDPLDRLVNEDFNRGVEHGARMEREACARIADGYANAPRKGGVKGPAQNEPHPLRMPGTGARAAKRIAELIRARAGHTDREGAE